MPVSIAVEDSLQEGDSLSASLSPSRKRRSRPSPISPAASVNVSRHSGLASETGTFGFSSRFQAGGGNRTSSPNGHEFYGRNQLYKRRDEIGKECTQGIGPRKGMELEVSPKAVGPGSYDIVHSAAAQKSSLDGHDFCSTTMKIKLPSALLSKGTPSPGPHASYQVRKEASHNDGPEFCRQRMSHGTRHRFPEDKDQPGPGAYTLPCAISAPNLKSLEAAGGTKRCVKSTFGVSDRFPGAKMSCSPQGENYYTHNRHFNGEDYLKMAKSCGFGKNWKIDFSNPYKAHRSDVSPHSYMPHEGYSSAGKSSALDGFASRCASPVGAAFRSPSSPASPSRRTPGGGASMRKSKLLFAGHKAGDGHAAGQSAPGASAEVAATA